MGYSFAAGTTDGPGSFAFEQGTITPNPFWNMVRNFIAAPTDDDIHCHGMKPILLATGRVNKFLFLKFVASKQKSNIPGLIFGSMKILIRDEDRSMTNAKQISSEQQIITIRVYF